MLHSIKVKCKNLEKWHEKLELILKELVQDIHKLSLLSILKPIIILSAQKLIKFSQSTC